MNQCVCVCVCARALPSARAWQFSLPICPGTVLQSGGRPHCVATKRLLRCACPQARMPRALFRSDSGARVARDNPCAPALFQARVQWRRPRLLRNMWRRRCRRYPRRARAWSSDTCAEAPRWQEVPRPWPMPINQTPPPTQPGACKHLRATKSWPTTPTESPRSRLLIWRRPLYSPRCESGFS